MANVVIEHPDGRAYSTSVEAFHRLYEPEGFVVVGEESEASFDLVGVPEPKAPRRKPRAKVPDAPVEEAAPEGDPAA